MSNHTLLRALFPTTSLRHPAVAALLAASAVGLASAASAQTLQDTERQAPDQNGVDVITGKINIPMLTSITVGNSKQGGLTYAYGWAGGQFFDTFNMQFNGLGNPTDIIILGQGHHFSYDSGTDTYSNADGDGATLVHNTSISGYVYTQADGTAFTFLRSLGDSGFLPVVLYRLSTITKPDGEVITYSWDLQDGRRQCNPPLQNCVTTAPAGRLQGISSNRGYLIKARYASNTYSYAAGADNSAWSQLTSVQAINMAVDYCNPGGSGSCTGLTQSWPTLTVGSSTSGGVTTRTFTDPLGNTSSVGLSGSLPINVKRPAGATNDLDITYDANNRVQTYHKGGGTWTYAYSDSGTLRTTTVTQPLGGTKVWVSDTGTKLVQSYTDENAHTTSYQYDSFGRLTQTTYPETNYTHLTYDARGNVTETRQVAKPGSGLSDIVSSASFDAACANPVTCNQPNSTTDANGNETDYTYDPAHGGVLTVTPAAPATGAVRPQARYSYSALSAYYKNFTGSIVAAPSPIYVLTGTSTCQTTASCSGVADEVKTTIAHGSTGVANNLLATAVTTASGDGALTATTGYGYDVFGNMTTVDGPLSGTDDTTTYRYDANQQVVGVIGPDPDGAGSRKRAALKIAYDADGNVTQRAQGSVAGTSDADWAAFSGVIMENTTYDAFDRVNTDSLAQGGFTQYGYDADGRLQCTALRVNTPYTSLPDACTPRTAGTYGYDRVTRATFDPAGQVTQVTTAYGTPDPSNDQTRTYNANGTVATLADANGNLTTYDYDGFDRLSKTRYPDTTLGAGTSSASDYEQLGYDPAGNVTSRRLRDTTSIAYTYDHLNRPTLEDLPGSDPDVTLGYDLLGRLTSAATSAQTLTFGYDALSRMTSQGGPLGTMSAQYDAAGRRTRLTWPDAFYVTYDYDTAGNLMHIRETGAASGTGVLAAFAYDDMGRRTSLTRGNGTITGYTFDTASRLATLTQDLSGTAADLTLTLAYTPPSQIKSVTRSNTAYSASFADKGLAYTVNGLNQTIASGTDTIGYDAMGNVHTVNADTYTYDHENLLLTGPNGAGYSYDPLMRLFRQASTGALADLQYDGLDMVGEYDALGTLRKRYVFGPGTDEPLVEYDRSGGTFTRAWLHADERGSIVARSDDTGAKTAINSYDEYGVPAAGNVGRFQYTGQAWLPELGVYYYKARLYASRLGRFLQTDPIGYGDGLNWYNYVGGDPINGIDPMGLNDVVVIANKNGVEKCPDGYRPKGRNRAGRLVCTNMPLPIASLSTTGSEGGAKGSNSQEPPCPRVSAGDIRRHLPDKGVVTQLKDGVSSYIQGVAWGATALAARVGLLGSTAEQQAINTNAQLGQVLGQIASHPGQTASFVGAVVSKYPVQVAGRIGTGIALSAATTPYLGVPVTGLAAYGTAFKEAYQNPNVVAAAVVAGESCTP